MIPVSKPFMPPKEIYNNYLEGIWSRQWLTNMGPLSSDLELKLKAYLNVHHLLFVTNGTIALQMAIKALELEGEIITTPFSFIATTSCIVWEGCTPVFVDIDKNSLNIDANKIEDAITEKTSAILATHVYGNPCDVKLIDEIAKRHNLRVIYDAAHSFGVKIGEKSIFEFGDISTTSLHATKLYHSAEGGLIVTKDPELLKKLAFIRNFGFNGPTKFQELGINGKNSEFHAAMGLANIGFIDDILSKRKELTMRYFENLGVYKNLKYPSWNSIGSKSYAYFPVIFPTEEILLETLDTLQRNEIAARRYFYPSLSNALPYLPSITLEVTEDISKRIACLPLYYDLSIEEVDLICRLILRSRK